MSSFEEALAAIQAADASLSEDRVAVDQLTIELDMLSAGERQFRLTEKGLALLCNRFERQPKPSVRYLSSLPAGQRTELLRLHLSEGVGGDGTISLFRRGADLVGFGRPDLGRLTGGDVLEAASAGTGGRVEDLEVTRSGVADESLQFDLIVHRASHEVRRGDVVTAGVRVTHSLTGDFATRIEGYLHRLACTNGAVHRECVGPREVPRTRRLPTSHPRAREQQREQIRRLVADALGTLNRRFAGLERLTTERMDVEHFATHWLRRSRLSPHRLMPLLRQAHAEEGGEETAYGALNAFTRVATHQTELSPNIRDVLAHLGGLLAVGHSRLCPRCWSLIAASN